MEDKVTWSKDGQKTEREKKLEDALKTLLDILTDNGSRTQMLAVIRSVGIR